MSKLLKWTFALMATGVTSLLVYDYFTGGNIMDQMNYKLHKCKCQIEDDLEDMM